MKELLKKKIATGINKASVTEKEVFMFENILFPVILFSCLLGMVHVKEDVSGKKEEKKEFADVKPSDAIHSLVDRLDLPPEVYRELSAAAHFKTFSAARLTCFEGVARLKEHLKSALEKGNTMEQWVAKFAHDKTFKNIGFHEENPYYLETVFRTNVSTSYNGGKWRQIQNSKEDIFAIEYVGIPDDRQTDICENLSGTRLPPDHPFWKTWFPPNHYNERSTTRIISKAEAKVFRFRHSPTPSPGVKIKKEFRASPENWWKLTPGMVEKINKFGQRSMILKELKELGEDIPVLLRYLPVLRRLFRSTG